ncbi:MAG: 5'-deoxyadenosine deaminase [Acidobacteriota bacterium]
MASLRIRNATILTMNDARDVIEGDVVVEDGRIVAVGKVPDAPAAKVIDARGGYLLPGFVQTHVHLCQTLFRGWADDRALLPWLRDRVWPMEAAHTPASLAAAARLAALELLAGGTTTVLTMETVRDTDAVFEALEPIGLRAIIGKCLMDADGEAPARLIETTSAAVDESLALAARWHGRAGGRLGAALAPRFALSCSRELLEAVAALSSDRRLLVHSHASENRDEVALVRRRTGLANVAYFHAVGLASPRLCLAHCVWVDDAEQALLAEHDVKVLHCPGSNLKLGSGIAPVAALRARGVAVSLGADGAACNNRLDMFEEMRLAAVLQATTAGPGALPAREVVAMATREGARALGRLDDLGTIEVGKRADLIVIDRDRPHHLPGPDPYSTIVYAARATDVRTTVVDGHVLVDEFRSTRLDAAAVADEARREAGALARRAGV